MEGGDGGGVGGGIAPTSFEVSPWDPKAKRTGALAMKVGGGGGGVSVGDGVVDMLILVLVFGVV